MNLTNIITDCEMQIHMVIRGEFRIDDSTVAKGEETTRWGHFSKVIGIIKAELIAQLVKKWRAIMRIITMEIGIILII